MYIIVVGAGKVGWNLARELLEKDHEVTVIENERAPLPDRRAGARAQRLIRRRVRALGAGAGRASQRADMVIAVTGDDEDNMLICQVAREKYDVEQIIARVNNPRNRQHFDLLGIKPSVSATDLILRLLEHEVPEYGLVHLLDLQEEQLEIIEMLLGKDSGVTGRRVGDLEMPRGQPADLGAARTARGSCPAPTPCWRRRRGAGRARPGPRGGPEGAASAPPAGGNGSSAAAWERGRRARSTSC